MFKSVNHYLKVLLIDGHFWQRTNVSGKEEKYKYYFSGIQLFILAISIILAVITSSFSTDFIGYLLASFSIFIALFLQLIVSVYTKFGDLTFDVSTENKQVTAIQIKNFSKQFTSLMSYSIIIAVFCAILLGTSLVTDYFNIENLYLIIGDFSSWQIIVRNAFGLIYKSVLFYFLFDFFYLLIYGVSSFYSFMKKDFDSKKIKE